MTITSEALDPIETPTDPRWVQLSTWLEANPTDGDGVVDVEELEPAERALWHQLHVLGIDNR